LANVAPIALTELMQDLAAIVNGEAVELPRAIKRQEQAVSLETLQSYRGRYQMQSDPDQFVCCRVEHGQLFQVDVDGNPTRLFAESPDVFFVAPDSTESLTFLRDAKGQVTDLTYLTAEGWSAKLRKIAE